MLVSGEAGIGKSRLIAAMQDNVGDDPPTTLRYFCSPHHRDSMLYPFIAQLERWAGFARNDRPAARLGKLKTSLGPFASHRQIRSPSWPTSSALPMRASRRSLSIRRASAR